MAKQKLWNVTTKPGFPGCGAKTFKNVPADTNIDAKAFIVKQEFGHMFTGLFKQMTAKRVK